MDTDAPETAPRKPRDLMVSAIDEVSDLLAVFVVPEECVITDLTGKNYTFAPVLSARRTIRAAQLVQRILSARPQGELDRALDLGDDRGSALQQAVLHAAGDPELEGYVDQLFALCQPEVLALARQQAAATKQIGLDGTIATDTLDIFELSEVLNGLLPFSARVATSVAAVLRRATGSRGSSRPSQSPPSAN